MTHPTTTFTVTVTTLDTMTPSLAEHLANRLEAAIHGDEDTVLRQFLLGVQVSVTQAPADADPYEWANGHNPHDPAPEYPEDWPS